jgi:hypothetical protein
MFTELGSLALNELVANPTRTDDPAATEIARRATALIVRLSTTIDELIFSVICNDSTMH